MQTRRVRALVAKTEFVSGHGMVPFDPDSQREELRFPAMPVDVIPRLVQQGWIADDYVEEAEAGDKPLSRMNKTELLAVAAAEGVDVEDSATKKEIEAAIEAKRADPPADDAGSDGNGDDDNDPPAA